MLNSGQEGLARYLSRLDVWALSLGCIIGWGAFVMPGTTFLPIAGPLGTVVAVIAGALVMLVIGSNYIYLMKQYPGIGGVYSYTKATMGRDHAFLSSWFLCLSYLSLIPQNATALVVMCRALNGHPLGSGIHYTVAGSDVYIAETAIAVAVLVVIAFLSIYCRPFLQKLLTILVIVMLIGAAIISAAAIPYIHSEEVVNAFGAGDITPVRAVMSIVILAPWAFVGFEVVSLETAHFDFQIHKTGILIGLAIILGAFIYVSMAITAVTVQPQGYGSWNAYIADIDGLTGIAAIPTFFASNRILGRAGLWIIAITATSAVISSVIGFYRASGRILTNMAEDKILTERFRDSGFSCLFIMALSILISLFGRRALSWVVDLSSVGAIAGFGYASLAVFAITRGTGEKKQRNLAATGICLSVLFAAAQMIPRVSAVQTMTAESYMLLALWCLAGFLFYWRTMNNDPSQGSESTTIAVLFFLQIFSVMVWYIKNVIMGSVDSRTVVGYSIILMAIILLGLIIMLSIHAQLKKRQLELETERIRAVENSQAKSKFLFNMSHDIRTPMNAILGFTHLALSDDIDIGKKNEYLRKIDSSGHQLLSIINDVLDMSSIENDKMELMPTATDLRKMMDDIRDLFSAQMEEKDIDFTVDTSGIRNNWVICDGSRFNRVVLNLVGNACKFTPEGGKVQALLRQTETGGDAADYELVVRDSGIGMSEDFTTHLFEPFERERTSTDSGIQGTGLGLSITKAIIDGMGGTIDVDTAPGRGTEFTVSIRLPFSEPAESETEDPVQKDIDFSNTRLLLVDDNIVNTEIARMILEERGFMVETAENGQIAVDMVSDSEYGYYDAVLMDIQMPVMDGYEATRTIRSLDDSRLASIPVIAMTANAFAEDVRASREAGMQGHIAKPIDVDVMMKTITEVLAGKTAGCRDTEEVTYERTED